MATNINSLLKCKTWFAKALFTFLLTLLSAQTISAYDFVVDGICYNYYKYWDSESRSNITDSTAVSITCDYNYRNGYNKTYNNKDTIDISATIVYNNQTLNVIEIGSSAFRDCYKIKKITLPNSVTLIDNYAFSGCINLTNIDIPSNVKTINFQAFEGCGNLTVTLPNSIVISNNAFEKSATIKVERGSKTLLSLWANGYDPYDKYAGTKLPCPVLTKVASTQTSFSVKAENLIEEYTYYVYRNNTFKETHGEEISHNEMHSEYGVAETLFPQTEYEYDLYIYMGDRNSTSEPYYVYISYPIATDSISPNIKFLTSASSIRAIGTYIEGDAQVIAQNMKIYNDEGKYVYDLITETDEGEFLLSGLDPQKKYTFQYTITVDGNKKYYSSKISERTSALSLTTSQPKVVSPGNVIVAAETNLDDEETNVGFEWRRTDWNDDFASNTGGAYLYEGTMEGYIRNLNTEKLWKFRPYYLSNSGTYYYGDWVGLDPTNTSYFEPTVHTYATINIEGNTALVKGYALTGTDKVTVQGFKYWKSAAMTRALSTVPTDAMTVEASGQVMTASLTGLEYNSTYHYVAFVTTSEGDTFYGEEQVFATGEDPTGIEEVFADLSEQEPGTVVVRYNIRGERISAPQKGLNILRMSDGSTKKVFVK